MEYGYFDNDHREYVITKPETPYPWINYLGCNEFFSLISNTGSGYCFYKDARLRRVLRYRYNDTPMTSSGRYFYIKDEHTIYNVGKYPAKEPLDFYECRHGMSYTRISCKKKDVATSHLAYVPLGMNCEVHQLTLKNEGEHKKKLKVFSYMEFCLWDAWDDQTNFQRNYSIGQVEVDNNFIYHTTEYRERRNHYAFVWCDRAISGFDTDRESFVGLYNGLEQPDVVSRGQSKNSIAHGWAPIASYAIEVELNPQEEQKICFVLGYAENEPAHKFTLEGKVNGEKAKAMVSHFEAVNAVDDDMNNLRQHWERLLSKFRIESDVEELNTMVNLWNQYQCMVTFHLSRSASFFESGIGRGMGFRDSNQDILGFVHQIPEKVRERIIDLAATQFSNGSAYHQYQPLTKKGNTDIGGGFNDDPLWLILATIHYIKETGDYAILQEMVGFSDGKEGILLDHLQASFDHVVNNKGPHGLPLIGRADWNDCLNLNCHSTEPGESFQTFGDDDGRVAESVMIAGLFIYAGKMYKELLLRVNKIFEAQKVQSQLNLMRTAVMQHGWDGRWFLRAYDAFSDPIGSESCTEGKIFIESQGLCVMAGLGMENGRAEQAIKAVEEILETPYGIMLQQPAYSKYYSELGEISSYPPGYKENAGIFCHNNAWITCAQAALGRGDDAFRTYKKIAPAFIKDLERHRTEPYVYSQMIAGKDATRFGEAKNSWLTGTASWCFVAVTQWILGIQPDFDGLKIDPCLPCDIKECTVTREFRGTQYIIHIKNPNNAQKGVQRIKVDSQEILGNIIPVSCKKICNVEVCMKC